MNIFDFTRCIDLYTFSGIWMIKKNYGYIYHGGKKK